MFIITEDKSIYLTRGDIATIEVSANEHDGTPYAFRVGDIVRLKVFKRKQHDVVVLEKDVTVTEESITVDIHLERIDTRIGEVINKPVDYWYEVELNPDTAPQTIVGYDSDGPKIFRLFPEGGTIE